MTLEIHERKTNKWLIAARRLAVPLLGGAMAGLLAQAGVPAECRGAVLDVLARLAVV